MAIFFQDKEITSVYWKTKAITAIYHGGKLIWEAIRSCFGKGFWIGDYSWNNVDGWKNNS